MINKLVKNHRKYFQIFILPSKVPYFNSEGNITKIDNITEHNLLKYINLSNDNISDFMHTPNKTLVYLIDITDIPENVTNYDQYIEFYQKLKNFTVKKSEQIYDFGNSVIYNNYEEFIEKVAHSILAI